MITGVEKPGVWVDWRMVVVLVLLPPHFISGKATVASFPLDCSRKMVLQRTSLFFMCYKNLQKTRISKNACFTARSVYFEDHNRHPGLQPSSNAAQAQSSQLPCVARHLSSKQMCVPCLNSCHPAVGFLWGPALQQVRFPSSMRMCGLHNTNNLCMNDLPMDLSKNGGTPEKSCCPYEWLLDD